MNEFMITEWNARIHNCDLVYHLGDFAWGEGKSFGTLGVEEIIRRLNGQIILIRGSHDKPALKLPHLFVKIIPLLEIHPQFKGEKYHITLCHYAMRVWPRSHFNSWHLYGHSHCRLESIGKNLDVGVDCHGFAPWSLEEVIEYMENRPDNLNYINKE